MRTKAPAQYGRKTWTRPPANRRSGVTPHYAFHLLPPAVRQVLRVMRPRVKQI